VAGFLGFSAREKGSSAVLRIILIQRNFGGGYALKKRPVSVSEKRFWKGGQTNPLNPLVVGEQRFRAHHNPLGKWVLRAII
jgi:hypothetical protein